MQYDVIVIGSGVTGAMTAYQLSQYQLRVCVVDKRLEPAAETSRASSTQVMMPSRAATRHV